MAITSQRPTRGTAAAAVDTTLTPPVFEVDFSTLDSASYSDGTVSVGGFDLTVANSANCTKIGPDGSDGIIFEDPTGSQYGGTYTFVNASYALADLIGGTPSADRLYVVQFEISDESEPVSSTEGWAFGFREDQSVARKLAGMHHGTGFNRLYAGATTLQSAITNIAARTVTMFYQEGFLFWVQMSTSVETTPFINADGLANTKWETGADITADVSAAGFNVYFGMYINTSSSVTRILKKMRVWELGKVS